MSPIFRRRAHRRALDPVVTAARETFAPVASAVERAQRSLLQAIPTSRDEGVPLAQALAGFTSALAEAAAAMPGWRSTDLERTWTIAHDALANAQAEAERLRLDPQPLDFESLNARVGDVLHPLETFAEIERSLRRGERPSLA